jgi:hypothetical protein
LERDLARLLSAAEFQPGGLSPSAILCVRSLRDPLPRTIRRQNETRLSPLWEQTVRATLDDIARTAARAGVGPVPANVQAVVFADRAELLACLARDFSDGRVAARWWWRILFRGIDVNVAALSAWLETPAYVPAALALLAEQKRAVAFIRLLPALEMRHWLQALCATFALSELDAALYPLGTRAGAVGGAEGRLAAARDVHAPPYATREQRSGEPPWQNWAPEAIAPGLSSEGQCLLGIGLMLRRAPLAARSSSFARAVKHWIEGESLRLQIRSNDRVVDVPAITAPVSAALPRRETRRHATHLSATSLLIPKKPSSPFSPPEGGGGMVSAAPESPTKGNQPEQEPTESVAAPTPDTTATDDSAAVIREVKDRRQTLSSATPSSEVGSLAPASEAAAQDSPPIQTEYGGVFYLVNLGLFLGLYGDFTTPLRRGIGLSPWDFVAFVGRELVGRRIEKDPVWDLLRELAGRPDGVEPGEGFAAPEQNLENTCETLSLPCFTVPFGDDGGSNASAPMQQQGPPLDDNIASLRRWLLLSMPYLRARLERALGLKAGGELAAVLCQHRAHVSATPAHLDVHFSLTDLPIAIRLAGLDRDPGWVPAAGRFIAFHFD